MKKLLGVIIILSFLILAIPVRAEEAGTLVVDDDGVECPAAIYSDISSALDAADNGDTIRVCAGTYMGDYVDKSVEIIGIGRAIIDTGPLHPAGLTMGFRFLAGSDGSSVSHLIFDNVDLAIMNGGPADNVTIEHNKFLNAIQAISNWRGNGWIISHNEIVDLRTRSGGGIGILIGDYSGGAVKDNLVSHNKIYGSLFVDPNDCGGYAGSGIVIYADFRWGALGATDISNNSVVRNTISLVSDTPEVVDVNAFELTQSYYPDDPPDPLTIVIFDNAIGFNDFRGTESQILISPEELEDENSISRNLGDNRGQGSHPSVFTPGGY